MAGSGPCSRRLGLVGLAQDIRLALRRLARSPGLAIAVVAVLAVAIGLDAAVFRLVDSLLLRPLPVERPAELVHVYTVGDGRLLSHGPLAFPDFEAIRDRTGAFSSIAAHALQPMSLDGGDRSELVMGEVVTGGYFLTLGLEPARGRLLAAPDDRDGAPPVLVLGHEAWRRRFGADPEITGRTVRLSGRSFTVVGVAPPGFAGLTRGLAAELWVPVRAAERLPTGVTVGFGETTPGAGRLDDRSRRWAWTIARRRPGAGTEAAQAELGVLARRLAAEHPDTHRRRAFAVVAAEDVRLLPGVDRALQAGSLGLAALAGLVLLVAVSNVGNLLLARAAARRRELVVRRALGAGRGRLARELLAESLLLALAGAAAGLLVAAAAPRLAAALVPSLPWPVAVALDLSIDGRVLAFVLTLALVTATAFGLAPLPGTLRIGLAGALREEGSTPARARRRLTRALVVVQIAVSVVLLVGLGLTARGLARAQQIDPGFEASRVVIATFAPELQGYDAVRTEDTFRRLEEAFGELPEVAATSAASHLPLTFGLRLAAVSGDAGGGGRAPGENDWLAVDEAAVGPGYFETLAVPLRAGRGFAAGDRPVSDRVAVVNETLAARLWPGDGAVGRTLRVAGEGAPYRVVGVAADGRYRTLGEPPRPFLYRALAQHPVGTRTVVLRAAGDPARVLAAVERTARRIDPGLPVLRLRTYRDALSDALLLPRLAAGLLGLFGALALGLAAVGLHGLLAHAAVRRTRELAVHMALGASRRAVVRRVVAEGARLAAVGLAVGLAASLLLGRALEAVLYGVEPTDPATYAAAVLTFGTVSLVASYQPARRASRVDPGRVLR